MISKGVKEPLIKANQLVHKAKNYRERIPLRQANWRALIADRISPEDETASEVRAVLSGTLNLRTPCIDSELAMAANAFTCKQKRK